MQSLTWDQVRARRLARSHLVGTAPAGTDPAAVAAAVCGLQAQVMAAAELGLGARIDGVDAAAVRSALWEDRRLVKTYGPRGTLHLLPSAQLDVWMAAVRASVVWAGGAWYDELGLTAAQGRAALDAVVEALDGRCLTRDELAAAVVARVGEWAGEPLRSAWGALVAPAAWLGLVCSGPPRRNRATFVRVDQWLDAPARDLDPADALAEVARWWLAAYGPAPPARFSEWFRVDVPTAAAAFARCGADLEDVDVEGTVGRALAADVAAPWPDPEPSVRLLPEYDCYVLGWRERDQLSAPDVRDAVRAYRRGRWEGVVAVPVVLVDGRVAGVWERRRRTRRVDVVVPPSVRLDRRRAGLLDAEVARVGGVLGLEATLAREPVG